MSCHYARKVRAGAAPADELQEQQWLGHMRECAECTELADQLERTWDALSSHPTLTVSSDFIPKVRGRIEADQGEAHPWSLPPFIGWRWAAMALCTLVIAGIWTSPHWFRQAAPVSSGRISAPLDMQDDQLLQDVDKLLEYSAVDSLSTYDSWPGVAPEGSGPDGPKMAPVKKMRKKVPA